MKPTLSILDLAPIVEGGDAAQALSNSLDLARHAEAWGYRRYWVAEHHNMEGVASSATAVLVGHIAGGTKTIRVGSGGVMLPNHAPLVIAEQFGTLATLYPGRIDLGLGRAPGTDRMTMRALRRHLASSDEEEGFPRDVLELQSYSAIPSMSAQARARGRRTHRRWQSRAATYGTWMASNTVAAQFGEKPFAGTPLIIKPPNWLYPPVT